MNKLKTFCLFLILASLISCDDKAAKSTTTVQPFPKFDSLQTPTEIQQLEALLIGDPNNFGTLSSLGDLYFESSRYIEAIQTYDKALAVNPTCADCLNDRGLALYYSGDPAAALESFDQAIAMAPEYTHAWLSKGYVLISQGRYQEAIIPLNKVKELDPTGNLVAEADKFLALAAQRGVK
jgi:tetratricopeptide (TPR) repeat protein